MHLVHLRKTEQLIAKRMRILISEEKYKTLNIYSEHNARKELPTFAKYRVEASGKFLAFQIEYWKKKLQKIFL